MFDIGFAELIFIGVIALLVIGPERLPETVRTASAWLNRIRRSFNEIKREVQQELHNDAVLRDLRETGDQLKRETGQPGRERDDSSGQLQRSASAHPPPDSADETRPPDS